MRVFVCLAVLVGLLAPGDPPSPEQIQQARALYEAGGRAYSAGKLGIAIDAFESARAIVERDVVVFALAQAYRLRHFEQGEMADLDAAVKAYRRYLALAPEGKRRIHATQHLSVLAPFLERKRIETADAEKPPPKARLIVTSDVADATAQVDGGPSQPIPATFEVDPGPHMVQVSAPKHRDATQETIAVAETAVAVALQPDPVPGNLTVRAPASARLSLDGARLSGAARRAPIEVLPGTHTLIARASGHRPQARRFEIRSGEPLAVDIELEPTTQRMIAWGALGASGLLATGGLITGVVALDAQSDAQDLETRLGAGLTGAEFDEHDRLRARRDDYASATLVLGVTAGVALVSGVLLWIFDEPTAEPVTPAPPAPGAASAALP